MASWREIFRSGQPCIRQLMMDLSVCVRVLFERVDLFVLNSRTSASWAAPDTASCGKGCAPRHIDDPGSGLAFSLRELRRPRVGIRLLKPMGRIRSLPGGEYCAGLLTFENVEGYC